MADAVEIGSIESMRIVGLECVKAHPNRWCELTLDLLIKYVIENSSDQAKCLNNLCGMYPREYMLQVYLIELLFSSRMDLIDVWYKEASRDFSWNVEMTWNLLTQHWYVMGGAERVLDEWKKRIVSFPHLMKQAFQRHYVDFCMVEGMIDFSIDV